jgi:hypothetical protein
VLYIEGAVMTSRRCSLDDSVDEMGDGIGLAL